ncbi:transposase [Lacticaseibacillus paracasei subsp. paracasei CNCM I-4649]|uniref:transposase n=1 Tax=Lacticaseibacillus paracasei TaxID=1597 RepID=UPI000343E2B1|nr:transposase [Lacticaseibacillus paracasei]EPC80859.1 transposase [Lacticaseibacillus paracasei subsp. paracasei CNCM I-4649]
MSSRKRYSVEFKQMIVQLYESGTSITDLTSEYGIVSTTIYKWHDLNQKDEDNGASKADLLAMQARIAKLESENDILKKVLTIFVKSKHQGLAVSH